MKKCKTCNEIKGINEFYVNKKSNKLPKEEQMNKRLGQVLTSKSGNFYIRLGQAKDKDGNLIGKNATNIFPITLADGTVLQDGDALFLKDPRVTLSDLASKGIISGDLAEERSSRIPEFVKYDVEIAASGN